MKIKELNNLERPREKMAFYGAKKLSNRDLMAVVLKSGTKDKDVMSLAQEIVNYGNDNLKWLADASIEELMTIDGIGFAKASLLVAVAELGFRINSSKAMTYGNITQLSQVIDLFMVKLKDLKKETFNVVMLDAKGNVIAVDEISVGDLTSSIVHPRETFQSAVRKSASSVICVHNHPSGDPSPSKDDIETTKRLEQAGRILGIEVLDHVIIGDGIYFSMKEKGII